MDCDIRNQLPQVLDVHCKIELNENNEFILTNLSSVNPTHINGQVLNLSERLKHGDLITIIDRSYRFECSPPKTQTAGKDKKVQALQDKQEKSTPVHAEKRKSEHSLDTCLKDGSNLQTSVEQSVEDDPFFELCQIAKQDLAKSPRKSELPKPPLARPQVDQVDLFQEVKYLLSLLNEDNTGPAIPQSSFHASQEEKTVDDMLSVGSITPPLTERSVTPVSQKKRKLKTPQKFSAGEVVQQILLEPQHEDKTPKSPKGRRSVGSQDQSLDLQMPLGQPQTPGPIGKKTKVKMSPRTSVSSNAGNRSEVQGLQEQTPEFIKMRADNDHLFTGNNKSNSVAWGTVLKKMGLLGKATPTEARRKWKYLKKKYKDCKCKKANAETWPWFALMDEVLGRRQSTNPPVLLASFPEDTSGSSLAVDNEDEEEPRSPPAKRKKGHVDELVKRWKYMSILNLLEPYITDRDTSSNFRQSTSCDEDVSVVALLESMISDESTQSLTQTQADTTQPGSPDSSNVPPLCTPKTSRRTLASKRRAEADQPCVLNGINSKPDEEEHFLLSLAGALRHLPPYSRSEVKIQFQQILHDAEFNN